jgi:hypothetical protein
MHVSRTAPSTNLLEELRDQLAQADIFLHRLDRQRDDTDAAIALRRTLARAGALLASLGDTKPAAELVILTSLRERARELVESELRPGAELESIAVSRSRDR